MTAYAETVSVSREEKNFCTDCKGISRDFVYHRLERIEPRLATYGNTSASIPVPNVEGVSAIVIAARDKRDDGADFGSTFQGLLDRSPARFEALHF